MNLSTVTENKMQHYEQASQLTDKIAELLGYTPSSGSAGTDPVMCEVYDLLKDFGTACFMQGSKTVHTRSTPDPWGDDDDTDYDNHSDGICSICGNGDDEHDLMCPDNDSSFSRLMRYGYD